MALYAYFSLRFLFVGSCLFFFFIFISFCFGSFYQLASVGLDLLVSSFAMVGRANDSWEWNERTRGEKEKLRETKFTSENSVTLTRHNVIKIHLTQHIALCSCWHCSSTYANSVPMKSSKQAKAQWKWAKWREKKKKKYYAIFIIIPNHLFAHRFTHVQLLVAATRIVFRRKAPTMVFCKNKQFKHWCRKAGNVWYVRWKEFTHNKLYATKFFHYFQKTFA